MANYSFVLRKPYQARGTMGEVKKRLEQNKSIVSLLNKELTPIMLQVSFDRKHRFKCKTNIQVYAAQWDFSKQRIKQQVSGSQELNQTLGDLLKNTQDEYVRLRKEKSNITFEDVRENIQHFVLGEQLPRFTDEEQSFFDVFDEFIRRKKGELHPRTIQKFETAKKVLLTFTDKYYNNFHFDSIDVNFIDKYKQFLYYEVDNQKSEEAGYRDDTVAKFIENLKNFLRWSHERGFHSNTVFQHSQFKAKRDKNLDIVTMKIQELKLFYKHDFKDNKTWGEVRDVYCFGAFTGQRWSDIELFDKADLHGDTWIFEAYKTKKETVIPFVGYAAPALDILKKYNYELPIISNQKFNDYVKLAAAAAKLTRLVKITRYQGTKKLELEQPLHEVVSSHMARRTAVSILLNTYRLPVNQVMEITGHTDYKTLKRYIDEDKDTLRQNLAQTKGIDEIVESDEPV